MAEESAMEAILDLAKRQHGVIAVRQLHELGLTRHAIHSRVAAGWLARLHRGVYAVGGRELSWRGRWMAAVLACGEGALLSHRAAASLWRLARPQLGDVDVTVPGGGGRIAQAGIALHRSTTLSAEDLSERDAIPVTSPTRTIIDLARAGMSGRPLERVLDEADRHRLLDSAAFNAAVQQRPLPMSLRSVLASHEAGSTLTRSDLEELFLALCRERDLPSPLVNAELLGLTVDFLWPQAALVVEVDARGTHDTGKAFQDDRDRDSLLVATGFRVLRFTHRDLLQRPGVVIHRIRKVLGS